MKVAICGPNLRDQSRGQFHVHTVDCKDLTRMQKQEPEYLPGHRMEFDVESKQQAVEYVYCDHIDENEGNPPWDTWTAYLDEFYFFPCVKDLK